MAGNNDMFKGNSILITGGTGSLGRSLVRNLLERGEFQRIIVFSRDELKQHEMKISPGFQDDRIRWFLGDVRDKERLKMAFADVDYVVHAAALKQVDTGEYNPIEFIKTNVLGSQNIVEASIETGVKKVLALSTDKASSPINLYGATKLTADKLFVSANIYGVRTSTLFSVVRYGNVIGSRGSVIPIFQKDIKEGRNFRITDKRMTRFWITLEQATNFVLDNLQIMRGGEIFVPKIPSMHIRDLATAMDPERPIEIVGIRPGEKLHEEMISEYESYRTIEWNGRFIILPDLKLEVLYTGSNRVSDSFSYRSDNNPWKLTISQMQKFISN
jgi:UDP-N-acetylglucosamine 4,6-dehydratase